MSERYFFFYIDSLSQIGFKCTLKRVTEKFTPNWFETNKCVKISQASYDCGEIGFLFVNGICFMKRLLMNEQPFLITRLSFDKRASSEFFGWWILKSYHHIMKLVIKIEKSQGKKQNPKIIRKTVNLTHWRPTYEKKLNLGVDARSTSG